MGWCVGECVCADRVVFIFHKQRFSSLLSFFLTRTKEIHIYNIMQCWVSVGFYYLRCNFQPKPFYDSIALHCTIENEIKFRVEQQICFFVRKCQIMKAWKLQCVWITQHSKQAAWHTYSSVLNRTKAWVKQGSPTPLHRNNHKNVSQNSCKF